MNSTKGPFLGSHIHDQLERETSDTTWALQGRPGPWRDCRPCLSRSRSRCRYRTAQYGAVQAEHRPQATQLPPRPRSQRWCERGPCEPVSLRACVRHVPDLDEGPTQLTLQQSHPAGGSVASRSMFSVDHTIRCPGVLPSEQAGRRRGWSRSRRRTGRTPGGRTVRCGGQRGSAGTWGFLPDV